MTPARGIALIAVLWFAFFHVAAPLAQEQPRPRIGPQSLEMEELEVRGLLEKPDRLYLPVSRQINFPLPTRFDLFLEDLARPVLPGEIINEGITNGGDRESGNAAD